MSAVLVVTSLLQGSDNTLSHAVVVADDQLDHVAGGLVVGNQVGVHVVLGSLGGP